MIKKAIISSLLILLITLSACVDVDKISDDTVEPQTLSELQTSLGPCVDEVGSLTKDFDDPTLSPDRKMEICKNRGKSIEICLGKVFDLQNNYYPPRADSWDNVRGDEEAREYLNEVEYSLGYGNVLSKGCKCVKTKEAYDLKIEKDITLSGKQILRTEKHCAMKDNCIGYTEGSIAVRAAEDEAFKKINEPDLEPPLRYLMEIAAKDLTAFCSDMLGEVDTRLNTAVGEEKEILEIERSLKMNYCIGRAFSGEFEERNLPDWLTLLGQGSSLKAEQTLEKYKDKYEFTLTGDEFNCPSTSFTLIINKKEGTDKGCYKGVMDSCASSGGITDLETCECIKNPSSDCKGYADYIGGKSVDYSAGLKVGLDNEKACKSYSYQDISQSPFCKNGFMQQLYIYLKNGCCVSNWMELPEQLSNPGSGYELCGYKMSTTGSGIWREATSNDSEESISYATWIPKYAAIKGGETCIEVSERNEDLVSC